MERITINDHISLTDFRSTDQADLIKWLNDKTIYRNTLPIPYPYTKADAVFWLNKTLQLRTEYDIIVNWAIRDEADNLIGSIGRQMAHGKDGHRDEIGYWLARPYWGRGIMTATIGAYVVWLFESSPSLVRIEAHVFAHNLASVRTLEKTGFKREGYLRKAYLKDGEFLDAILYARIRE